MSNKKVILGIAAGVAALAAVGIVLKRKGHLDGISERAGEMGNDLKDKFKSVKESAKKRFDEVVHKGGDIAAQTEGKNNKATTNTANSANNVADTIA